MDVELGAGVDVEGQRLVEFARLAQEMNRHRDARDTVSAVVAAALRAELGDAVGVLLTESRSIASAAASQPEVEQADQLQLECGEGPAVEAIVGGTSLVAVELPADGRWRTWGRRAAQLGWRSVLAVALTDRETFGALTVYSRRAVPFDDRHLRLAEVFARHAAVALANARDRESLARAVEARSLIGQAQGILMERYQLDAEQAFSVLRRYSSHGNRKLRHVAADVVQNRCLPADGPREGAG